MDEGHYARAVKLSTRALRLAQHGITDPHDEALLVAAAWKAQCLSFFGQSDEALPIAQACWQAMKFAFPKDHPRTLVSANLMAHILGWLGRSDEALEIAGTALAAMRRTLPEGHQHIQRTEQLVRDLEVVKQQQLPEPEVKTAPRKVGKGGKSSAATKKPPPRRRQPKP